MTLQVEIQDLRRMLCEKCEEIISDRNLAYEFYVRICEIEEDDRFTIVDDSQKGRRMTDTESTGMLFDDAPDISVDDFIKWCTDCHMMGDATLKGIK